MSECEGNFEAVIQAQGLNWMLRKAVLSAQSFVKQRIAYPDYDESSSALPLTVEVEMLTPLKNKKERLMLDGTEQTIDLDLLGGEAQTKWWWEEDGSMSGTAEMAAKGLRVHYRREIDADDPNTMRLTLRVEHVNDADKADITAVRVFKRKQ